LPMRSATNVAKPQLREFISCEERQLMRYGSVCSGFETETVPAVGFDGVMHGMAVRHLTPRECERIQGFPDDYTKITYKTADGPRYKALGNSMAVPVMRWIGERIQMVDSLCARK
jgi:site-specific DNA-cytosine methylase